MLIYQIVTYISEDGAFGGPVAVASAQSIELARRGHQVALGATHDGRVQIRLPHVDLQLHRPMKLLPGFSGLVSIALIRRIHNQPQGTIFHIHYGRNLLSALSVIAIRGHRYILQPHGMLFPDHRLKSRIWDRLFTRRQLRGASQVLALTQKELLDICEIANRKVAVAEIANGVARGTSVNSGRENLVMFIARLHPRKGVLHFAKAAAMLLEEGFDGTFEIFGPDEGDLDKLKRFLESTPHSESIQYKGTLAPGQSIDQLARARVYVLPSEGEVFPMTVLEALAANARVILGRDCGIAAELEARGAAVATDIDPSALAESIRQVCTDPQLDLKLEAGTIDALNEWLSIETVVDRLEEIYK